MPHKHKFYFYRCYYCGEWYYSNKVIKVKKCWKCNRSFQFEKSAKFSKTCTHSYAIEIIKYLKVKEENQYIKKEKSLI